MKELKAPDKVAQKMTHDGAVQENLATGEVTNISSREAEADFSLRRNRRPRRDMSQPRMGGIKRRKRRRPKRIPSGKVLPQGSALPPPAVYRGRTCGPGLQKYIRRSDRAADKLDAAKEAVPKKKVLKTERVFDETAGRGKTRLRFEEVEKKPNGHLRHNPLSRPAQEVLLTAHNEVHKVEQENVGVEAGHKGEELRSAAFPMGKAKCRPASGSAG